jgi:hypothetical protein
MRHSTGFRQSTLAVCAMIAPALAFAAGCGTMVKRDATEQLLSSDAVDRTVSQIDFHDLAGCKVYFDTKYIPNIKSNGFVNSEYIISALRQQLVASNCLLQDRLEDADYVVEARIGALGTDSHEVIVGLPANNFVSTAASVTSTLPPLPAIPEIALAKKNGQLAAAKIGVFAYDRRTRQPVWQSGIAQARSTAQDTWLFGAGPFQQGSIYKGTQFAGAAIAIPVVGKSEPEDPSDETALVAYEDEIHFREEPNPETGAPSASKASQTQPGVWANGPPKRVAPLSAANDGQMPAKKEPPSAPESPKSASPSADSQSAPTSRRVLNSLFYRAPEEHGRLSFVPNPQAAESSAGD